MATNAPIFVVGTPRSGTTLWAKILGRHSRIFMPGETHFFDDIFSKRKQLGDVRTPAAMKQISSRLKTLYERYNELEDQMRVDFLFADSGRWDRFSGSCKNYCDVLSRFMEVQMSYEGKARWGNNAPRDIFNMKDIVSCYPNVKVVVCVRDIRDFLISYKDKWKITSSEHKGRLKMLYHPVVTSLLWKSSMRAIETVRRKLPQENIAIVRYEDLVQEPDAVVRRVCEVIEEKFEADMLGVDSNNSSSLVNASGIFTSSIGQWREKLSNEEIWIAQRIAGEEFRKLGYAAERRAPRKLEAARIIVSSPVALYRALRANTETRGPLLPYAIRRVRELLLRKNKR